jgi:hypothetical protein
MQVKILGKSDGVCEGAGEGIIMQHEPGDIVGGLVGVGREFGAIASGIPLKEQDEDAEGQGGDGGTHLFPVGGANRGVHFRL